MKQFSGQLRSGFRVLHTTPRSQLASMTLAPGETTGGSESQHQNADQWLFVISGKGQAVISGKVISLHTGDLLLIEAGEPHEIKNTGVKPLETLNIYAPPEY